MIGSSLPGPEFLEFADRSEGAAGGTLDTEPADDDAAILGWAGRALAHHLAASPARRNAALLRAFGSKAAALHAHHGRTPALPTPPDVRFVAEGALGSGGRGGAYEALGAYHEESGTVFLDASLRKRPDALLETYAEELGHHIDAVLGGADARGDEGAIFREALFGPPPDGAELARLQAESDQGQIVVDGRTIEVEFRASADGIESLDADSEEFAALSNDYTSPDTFTNIGAVGDFDVAPLELESGFDLASPMIDTDDIDFEPSAFPSSDPFADVGDIELGLADLDLDVTPPETSFDTDEFLDADGYRLDEKPWFEESVQLDATPSGGIGLAGDVEFGFAPLELQTDIDALALAGNTDLFAFGSETDFSLFESDEPSIPLGSARSAAPSPTASGTGGLHVDFGSRGEPGVLLAGDVEQLDGAIDASKAFGVAAGESPRSGSEADPGGVERAVDFVRWAGEMFWQFERDTFEAILRAFVGDNVTGMRLGHLTDKYRLGFIDKEAFGEQATAIIDEHRRAGEDINPVSDFIGSILGGIPGQFVDTLFVDNSNAALASVRSKVDEGEIPEELARRYYAAESGAALLDDVGLLLGGVPGKLGALLSSGAGASAGALENAASSRPEDGWRKIVADALKAGGTSLLLDAVFDRVGSGGSAGQDVEPDAWVELGLDRPSVKGGIPEEGIGYRRDAAHFVLEGEALRVDRSKLEPRVSESFDALSASYGEAEAHAIIDDFIDGGFDALPDEMSEGDLARVVVVAGNAGGRMSRHDVTHGASNIGTNEYQELINHQIGSGVFTQLSGYESKDSVLNIENNGRLTADEVRVLTENFGRIWNDAVKPGSGVIDLETTAYANNFLRVENVYPRLTREPGIDFDTVYDYFDGDGGQLAGLDGEQKEEFARRLRDDLQTGVFYDSERFFDANGGLTRENRSGMPSSIAYLGRQHVDLVGNVPIESAYDAYQRNVALAITVNEEFARDGATHGVPHEQSLFQVPLSDEPGFAGRYKRNLEVVRESLPRFSDPASSDP